MNSSKTCHITLWKGLAFLLLLTVSMPVCAAQEEKKKENPPPPRPQVQQQKPQVQRPQPQNQQPKPKPTYQQPKAQPQYERPKAQPQYQQPKAQPQFQQRGQQPQRTLAPTESQHQIQNLNRNRATMSGINRYPLPQGQVTTHANGSRTILASGGRQFSVRANGTISRVTLSGGRSATFRSNGGVRTIRAGGMQINHGLRGERQVVTVGPGHVRVVSMGSHYGYVERPYMVRGGRTYMQRTYLVNNVTYTRVYRSFYYHGVAFYAYVPPFYFHPRFYGWVYNPWPGPVYYRWPWFAAPPPWYGYWGPYFAPAPVYPFAALWLTDFLLAEDLRLAYEAQREAEANAAAQANQPPPEAYQPPPPAPQEGGTATQITPELKQAIAEEVRAQLAAEQQGASATPQQPAPSSTATPPAALDPARRLFVVTSNLTASTIGGQECELTGGDLITRLDDTPDNDNKVRVSVSSSKGNDCPVGSTLMMQVSDLQEMQNQFAENVDAGLKSLAGNSGKAGLPSAPDTGTTAGEVPPPPPDPNAGSALQAQQNEANQTEQQVQQEVTQSTPNQ